MPYAPRNNLYRMRYIAAIMSLVFLTCHYLYYSHNDVSMIEIAAGHEEDLPIYQLPKSFTKEPIHLTPINPQTLVELGTLSIDAAHRQGVLHTGGVLYVMDSSDKLLLMKRSSTVVTCPNTWSILGEHSIIGEDANDLPIRALKEELGLAVLRRVQMQNLTEHPLYYIRHYGARNGNRIDRQLTYMWLVKLPKPQEEIGWKLDHEVAASKWITLDEMDTWLIDDEKKHDMTETIDNNDRDDGPPTGDFCHRTIRSLLRVGIDRIKEIA